MKYQGKLVFVTLVLVFMILPTASAGQPLSDYTSYKQFAQFHIFAADIISKKTSNPTRFQIDHKIDMVYEETDKKNMRLESLGLNYDGGKLFFLEFPEKDNGVYVSFNTDGKLDALLLEIKKNKQGAAMFTRNEVILSFMGGDLLSNSLGDASVREQIMRVITGTRSNIDLYIDNKGFYVRIQNVQMNDSFYRVAIYRPEA